MAGFLTLGFKDQSHISGGTMSAIELTGPRIIAIADRGQTYKFAVARIEKKQWLKYFEGVVSSSENRNGTRVDSFESMPALVDLVESAVTEAWGYKVADGAAVSSRAGWQQMLPLRHRQAIGNALTEVERSEPAEDEALALGVETVYLNAVWGADEKGSMLKHLNRVHRFRTPGSEHQRRYSRDSMRSMIVGGSRRGTTKWLGMQPTLLELYDDLIDSVSGYQVNGQDLGEDKGQITQWMDAFHKVVAASALFAPASANVSDEGK
jgi:hypothetical protein